MNAQTADNSTQRRGRIVDWALIISSVSLIAGAVGGIIFLNYQLGTIQNKLIVIEKNYDVLRENITDGNTVLRENITGGNTVLRENIIGGNTVLREDLRDLRDNLTKHNKSHTKYGGGE